MIWKLHYEFWDLKNMSTKFHENMRILDAKTSMLVREAKRWISWAKLKIWPKVFNSESWMWKFSLACQIAKNHVLIQNKVKFMNFDWQVECKGGWDCWSHGESDEESPKYDGMFFEMKWIHHRVDEKWSSWNMKVFFTSKIWFGNFFFP